jgi:tripartite-type tricarboxylate transporter receptor subunit TctC
MSALPDIKSAAEQGLTEFSVTAWNVLMVPAGTPAPVKERLATEMRKILALPETSKALQDLGFEPAPTMNATELLAWTRAERQKYGEIIRAAKMKPE